MVFIYSLVFNAYEILKDFYIFLATLGLCYSTDFF